MELFCCYAYGRLSREDRDKIESNSIINQRDLLHDYIAKTPGLELTMEGYDDGYTGTNFDRPHMKELLEAVHTGKVNCVVVKDFSRFGRDHILGGRYIEKVFPALGVRFIAICDNYDSLTADPSAQLIAPIKNLFNDAYCHDTSVKIRTHLDVKRRRGDFIGSFAVYGYCKNPENKNHLLVDEPAADIVRDIFARRITGQSCQAIADNLNALGVLSPMEYKRAMGLNFQSGYRVHAKTLWSAVAVRRILQNAVYLGIMEQGKRTTPNYKVKHEIQRPVEDWMRVEGTHEAIISREHYDLVARLMLQDTRRAPGNETVHPLAGLLCCADCMGSMARKTTSTEGKKYAYYVCLTHRQDKAQCSTHSISEAKLEAAVLSGINLHLHEVVEMQKSLAAVARRPLQKITVQRLDGRLAALRAELAKKQVLTDALYRRYAMGEVGEEDFTEFKRIFSRDCRQVERAIAAQQAELNEILNSGSPDNPWIAYFRQYRELETLEREVLVRLVDRILIYDGGRIEIVFRHQEKFQRAMQFIAYQTQERKAV